VAAACTLLLAACAAPEATDFGRPAETHALASGGKVEYFPQLPYGHVTYAARYDADGKLVSFDQILNDDNIAKVVRGKTQMKEVRDLLGPPWQPVDQKLMQRTVWTYPMRIAGDPNPKWFVVQMSYDGVVRETYLMNDPQFDQSWGFRRR
jgi:hypothetical protein